MIKQLRVRRLIFLLIVGEIMTMSAVILAGMSIEEVVYMIAGFAGIWIIYALARVWVDSLVKWCQLYRIDFNSR